MNGFESYYWDRVNEALTAMVQAGWTHDLTTMQEMLTARFQKINNPNSHRFYQAVVQSPAILSPHFAIHGPTVTIDGDVIPEPGQSLHATATGLIPWRKGPFSIGGVYIDAEWRSDIKWDRLGDLAPWIHNRRVLDIGCNSGYYMFRMCPYSPKVVVGVDPSDLFFYQFNWISQWVSGRHLAFLPIKVDELGGAEKWFDTVFSMGILYHQRSPIDALKAWKLFLKKHGRLILETLILDDPGDFSITPKTTYAKMANVYHLPTLDCLKTWVKRAGFRTIDVVDVSRTTPAEQRKTPWVNTESLADFLDPIHSEKTIEGYPAPTRVILCVA